jgi:hypothetical protein
MKRIAIVVLVLVAIVVAPGCGGGLKASAIKPYTDQLAAVAPVVEQEVGEVVDLYVPDVEKRERIKGALAVATKATKALKIIVDTAAAAEDAEAKEGGGE